MYMSGELRLDVIVVVRRRGYYLGLRVDRYLLGNKLGFLSYRTVANRRRAPSAIFRPCTGGLDTRLASISAW